MKITNHYTNNLKLKSLLANKKKHIKNKIINSMLTNGRKSMFEKIVLKSLKELQKSSNKQAKKLIQLSIIASLPVLKINTFKHKKSKKIKQISSFIQTKNAKISLAIKFILNNIQKENYKFFTKFKHEIFLNFQFKSNSIELKNELQKQALIKKRYLINYYRRRKYR